MRGIMILSVAATFVAGCLADDDAATPSPEQEPESEPSAGPDNGPPEPSAPQPPTNETEPEPESVVDETQTPQPFAMDGVGCREMLVEFPIPTERARAFVPANYTLNENVPGTVLAFGGLKVCDDLVLDGTSIGPASTSDVGIELKAPDGTDGIHYYQAWWITDNPALADRLIALGWRAALAPTALHDLRTEGLVGDIAVQVDWSEGAYGATATGGASPVFPELDAKGWYDGPFGTVVVPKHFIFAGAGGGPGTVTATGGPMAELAGGEAVDGAAIIMEYTMAGRVEFASG